jgi:hypothetical protein
MSLRGGGLSQFNRPSRFLEDERVREKLEQAEQAESFADDTLYVDENGELVGEKSNKGLLDRLLDMYEK